MIRTRDWTYVHRYPDGPHDLYDLVNDSDERHDLADDRGHAPRIRERHELMKE